MKYYIYRYTHNDKTFYAAFTEDENRITPDVEERPLYRGGGIFTVKTNQQTTDGFTIVEGYNLKGKLVFPAEIKAYSIHYSGDGLFILDHRKEKSEVNSVYNNKLKCIIPDSLEYNWIGYYTEDKQIWCENKKRGHKRTYTSDGMYFAEGEYYTDGSYSATSYYSLSNPNERALFDYYKLSSSKATIKPIEDGRRGINLNKAHQTQTERQTQQPAVSTFTPTNTPTRILTNTQPAKQQKDNTQYREKCKYCTGSGECRGYNSGGGIQYTKLHCGGTGKCSTCNGTGLMWSTIELKKIKCSACNGNKKCTWCKGTGRCDKCGGTGYKK